MMSEIDIAYRHSSARDSIMRCAFKLLSAIENDNKDDIERCILLLCLAYREYSVLEWVLE